MEILIIIFCISIIYKIYEAKIKGYIGEKAVVAVLSGLPEGQYKILNDIMLQTEQGTTQIDHIVVLRGVRVLINGLFFSHDISRVSQILWVGL